MVGIGVLNPEKKTLQLMGKDPFLFRFVIPSMLSFLAENAQCRRLRSLVLQLSSEGIGYPTEEDGSTMHFLLPKKEPLKKQLSVALAAIRAAKSAGHEKMLKLPYKSITENIPYFSLDISKM